MAGIERIVILGHTGFVGNALFSGFQKSKNLEAHGYSSKELNLLHPSDFRILDAVSGPSTALIVTAGLTPDKGNDLRSLRANVDMAGNMGAYLADRDFGLVVFFSSDALYPYVDTPIREDSPIEPTQNYYAASKHMSECILQLSARSKGTPLLLLRLTAVFGPGDTHGSYGPNRFSRTISKDREVSVFGEGEETRDHIYIGDLVRITEQLVERRAEGIFNLATGRSRSFGEIVEDLKEIVPFSFEVKSRERSGTITHRSFDISALRGLLGDFQFIEFKDGLRATFDYFHQGQG